MADAALRLRDENSKKLKALKYPFTKTKLDRITPPAQGQKWIYDETVPGLSLLVQPSGSKRFYFAGRINGRYRRMALGEYPGLGIDSARKAVQKLRGEAAVGKDPIANRRGRGENMTFIDLKKRWLAHAKAHKRTAHEDERRLKKHLEPWEKRKVATIRHDDVVKLHRAIGRTAKYEANRVLALLRAMFGEAVRVGAITENPAAGVKKFSEQKRDRYLDAKEMPRFLAALDGELNQTARDVLWMLLLTAQRKGTVLSMRWADIDLRRRVWTIQQTKAGNVHEVPLPKRAAAILRIRERSAGQSKFVFPTAGRTGHFTTPGPGLKRVLKAAKIRGRLTIHDLRRTWASWANKARVDYGVIKRALDHSTAGDVTAIYAKIDIDTLRAGFEATAKAMLATRRKTRGAKQRQLRGPKPAKQPDATSKANRTTPAHDG